MGSQAANMETLGLKIEDLFNVYGLVAVITGGGTGTHFLPFAIARKELCCGQASWENAYDFV